MNRPSDHNAQTSRKPWTKPVINKIGLTEEEQAALRAADKPWELLRKLKPALWERSSS